MADSHIRVIKHDSPTQRKVLLYIGAILIALLIGAVLLLILGVNPLSYYGKMITMGMPGNAIAYKNFENYLKVFVPLLVTSLALALAFKMRFWNIGGEGQFIVGAILSATVAFQLGGKLPTVIALLLMAAAAMVGAGLYGLIAASLKVRFGTNETLMTLMLNYIALYVLVYLGETKADWNFYLNPESVRPIFGSFAKLVKMPVIRLGRFSLSLAVIVACALCVLMAVYMKYTKHGYELTVVGDSEGTARYAGMKVNRIVLRTVFASAALVGLAGMLKTTTAGVLSTSITDSVGWTGVIVAWLAKLSMPMIFVVSALIGILQYGSTVASSTYAAVDVNFANMLQGMILFCVLTADFFAHFRIVIDHRQSTGKDGE